MTFLAFAPRHIAAAGAVLALATFAIDANAGYRLLPRVDISTTGVGPGDTEPGVVGSANGTVFIAWIHNLSTSSQGLDLASVQSTTLQPIGDVRSPVEETPYANASAPLIVSRLAVTRSSAFGPLQVVGGRDSGGWHVVVSLPGPSTRYDILPDSTYGIPADVDLVDLSVPRHLRAGGGGDSLPIGVVLTQPAMALAQTTASFAAVLLSPTPRVDSGFTYAFSGVGPRAMRTAYWLLSDGAFFRVDPMSVEVDRADGTRLATTSTPFSAIRAAPGVTNVVDGQMYAVLRVFDAFSCYDQNHPDAPIACGSAPTFASDIDVDADLQYSSDVWFAASDRSGGGARAAGVVAGGSHLAGDVVALDVNGLEACEHARVAAVPGESPTDNQHAVVVASCIPTGTFTRRIYAWTLERPFVAPSDDAGVVTDAAISTDATIATDAASEDASSTPDGAIRSLSYRGSGCACRTDGSRLRSPSRALALAIAAAAVTATRRRRRASR